MMGFFDDARKALDDLDQEAKKHIEEAGKHVSPALAEAGKHIHQAGESVNTFGQQVILPAAEDAKTAAEESWKHLDPFLRDIRKHVEAAIDEASKHAGPVAEDTWKALDNFVQDIPQHVGGTAEDVKNWIEKNPAAAAGIAAGLLAPPVAAAAAFPILNAVGFGAGGVVAGTAAAGIQSGLGRIASGTLFTILQSAGAGGSGASLLGGTVFGMTSAASWAATIPQLLGATKNDDDDKQPDPERDIKQDGDDKVKEL